MFKRKRSDFTENGGSDVYADPAIQAAIELRSLADRYKNSISPEMSETIPDKIKTLARFVDYSEPDDLRIINNMDGKSESEVRKLVEDNRIEGIKGYKYIGFVDGEHLVAEPEFEEFEEYKGLRTAGWKWEEENEKGAYDVFVNEGAQEAYLWFDHYHMSESPKEFIGNVLLNNTETDDALTLRNITFNNNTNIKKNPQFTPDVEDAIKDQVNSLLEEGYNVKFGGYSKGGYAAKYWGSKFNIDQDLVNAHVMPGNTFDETSATSHFHTIATDETSFKYILPNDRSVLMNDKHTVYPPSDNVRNMNLLRGDIWGNHRIESFLQPQESLNISDAHSAAVIGSKIGSASETAGYVLAAGDIGFDLSEGKYEEAAEKAGFFGLAVTNPAAALVASGALLGEQSYSDWEQGNKLTSVRHGVEALALAGSATVNPLAGLVVGEGVGSIELGIQAAEDRKQGRKGDAAFEATESALLGAGALLAIPTDGLSVPVSAAGAGALHLINRFRHKLFDNKQSHSHIDERSKNDRPYFTNTNFANDSKPKTPSKDYLDTSVGSYETNDFSNSESTLASEYLIEGQTRL